MYEFLYKYFILNRKLALPGIGIFSLENVPATIDIVSQVLKAPAKNIQFSNNAAATDKQLLQYLSKQLQLNEADTGKTFNEFSKQLAATVLNGGAQLPGLGTLKKSYNGDIYFYPEIKYSGLQKEIRLDTPEISSANLVDVYGAVETEIITQKTEMPDSKKLHLHENNQDYWWLYALVLALMGVGALLYYYI
jgi:hypothetical protein